MTKTTIERVSGELVGANRSYAVDLNLTILETKAKQGTERILDDINPATLSGIPDGEYSLRFTFDGQPQEHAVLIRFGYLLAA